MNALLYLRVPTARQARHGGEAEGHSLPAQRETCRRRAVDVSVLLAIGHPQNPQPIAAAQLRKEPPPGPGGP